MTLNPKCVSLEKLYGQFDKDSYEWADGILATIIRRFAKESVPFQADGMSRGSAGGPLSRLSRSSTAKSGLATPAGNKSGSVTPVAGAKTVEVAADVSGRILNPSLTTVPKVTQTCPILTTSVELEVAGSGWTR